MTSETNDLYSAAQFRINPAHPDRIQVKFGPRLHWRQHSQWRDADEARMHLLRLGRKDAGAAQETLPDTTPTADEAELRSASARAKNQIDALTDESIALAREEHKGVSPQRRDEITARYLTIINERIELRHQVDEAMHKCT